MSIEKHQGDEFYGLHPVEGIRIAAPIRRWSAVDIVTYLVRNEAPWKGYGNYHLINLYGSAMNSTECPVGSAILDQGNSIQGCGGKSSRFGCFGCTVINDDTSLANLRLDYPELDKYYLMRQLLKLTQDIRYGCNSGYKRNRGNLFSSGLGDLTLDIRALLLLWMSEYEIPLLEEEVYMIHKFVVERECGEGIPVTKRFRDRLFSLVEVHPVFLGGMFSVFDPYGTVDFKTNEDEEAIKRVLGRMASRQMPLQEEGESI